MFDRATALEIIDQAFDSQRYCESCGSPTVLKNDGDTVVLECSADDANASVLERIGAFLVPHTRRIVIDLSEGVAA
jgi:hypothetical protein